MFLPQIFSGFSKTSFCCRQNVNERRYVITDKKRIFLPFFTSVNSGIGCNREKGFSRRRRRSRRDDVASQPSNKAYLSVVSNTRV